MDNSEIPEMTDIITDRDQRQPKPVIKMLNREGDTHEDEWHTYIAGLSHRTSEFDAGGFMGWVENDPHNFYDIEAMGVYNSFGRLLGYIPKKELDDYRHWCAGAAMPCMGYIFSEEGQIRGRVKILRPCNEEFLKTEFSRYAQWVYENKGKDYLPKTTSLDFNIE